MVTLEQVEKLREKTGVSWEEAKKALEETNGDLLEAVINLERQNRIKTPKEGGYYHSHQVLPQAYGDFSGDNSNGYTHNASGNSFKESIGRFFNWAGKWIHKGNTNHFKVMKNDEKIITIPLTAMVLLVIFAFWIVIPLILIGLFFGYRYWFEGPEIGNPSVNRVMDTVADAATNLKKDIANSVNDNNKGE